jgi:hypothetical protein
LSYEVTDSQGGGRQLATIQGIRDLEALKLPNLAFFLETGEADAERVKAIQTEVAGHPVAGYIADLLNDLAPPLMLTDGTT